MTHEKLVRETYFRPWIITPIGWQSVHRLVSNKLAQRPEADYAGEPLPKMTIEGGTAVIPIYGIIGQKLGLLEKSCGAVGVEDIAADLATALASPDVRQIILDIDSPGGTVGGVPELASTIARADKVKPVYAYSSGSMCSAAYWLVCGAREISIAQTADVGSIGVYLPFLDQSKAFENEGLVMDVIKAGEFKGQGLPGTSLSPEYRQLLQAEVNQIHAWFTAHVKANRPKAQTSAMEGQSFMGQAAVAAGLADRVVASIREVATSRISQPKFMQTTKITKEPEAGKVPLHAYFEVSQELFGSLCPKPTGNAERDKAALSKVFSDFGLTAPGLNDQAKVPSGANQGLQERLVSIRQQRVNAYVEAWSNPNPGILEQAARIANPIERTAFIREHETAIRVAIAASELDTANASKPIQHTTAENSLLAQYQAITDPAERTAFITKNETAIAHLLQSLK